MLPEQGIYSRSSERRLVGPVSLKCFRASLPFEPVPQICHEFSIQINIELFRIKRATNIRVVLFCGFYGSVNQIFYMVARFKVYIGFMVLHLIGLGSFFLPIQRFEPNHSLRFFSRSKLFSLTLRVKTVCN